jgi:hypothetical protein
MVSMFKLHAYFVFHLSQRCMLFYGQLEPKEVDEATFTKLFTDAEKLLIGQSRLVSMDKEQFMILNHEDIISGALVAGVMKQDEKLAIQLLTRLGKAFKSQFQAEVDEFNPNTCDLGDTFGGFSTTLAAVLEELFSGKEKKGGDAVPVAKVTEPSGGVEQDQSQTNGPRFPNGRISPEEIDEILFHEYEDLTSIYNVEMIDGVVSRSKIYVYTNVDTYHDIDIDYAAFPARPKIRLPPGAKDALAMSQVYQNWNAENPPRIVDLVEELEQLIAAVQPAPQPAGGQEDDVDSYMAGIGFDETTNGKGKPDANKNAASSLLADRLLSKEKKAVPQNLRPFETQEKERMQPVLDQIDDNDARASKKTSLKDMVSRREKTQLALEPGPVDAVVPSLPTPDELATPAPVEEKLAKPTKPQKFIIRPRFVIDGEEFGPASGDKALEVTPVPAQPVKKAKPAPNLGEVVDDITIKPRARPVAAPKDDVQAKEKTRPVPDALDDRDHGINIATRTKPVSLSRSFAIPEVGDLDSFEPAAPVRRPDLKVPATAPAPVLASSGQKPSPSSKPIVSPSSKPAAQKSAPAAKPAAMKKDDGDMFGWGDDVGEMEVKQSKVEIKDFDMPIKKVKPS